MISNYKDKTLLLQINKIWFKQTWQLTLTIRKIKNCNKIVISFIHKDPHQSIPNSSPSIPSQVFLGNHKNLNANPNGKLSSTTKIQVTNYNVGFVANLAILFFTTIILQY